MNAATRDAIEVYLLTPTIGEALAVWHLEYHRETLRIACQRGEIDSYKWRNTWYLSIPSLQSWIHRKHGANCRRCGWITPLDDWHLCPFCRYELATGRVYRGTMAHSCPAVKNGRVNGG